MDKRVLEDDPKREIPDSALLSLVTKSFHNIGRTTTGLLFLTLLYTQSFTRLQTFQIAAETRAARPARSICLRLKDQNAKPYP